MTQKKKQPNMKQLNMKQSKKNHAKTKQAKKQLQAKTKDEKSNIIKVQNKFSRFKMTKEEFEKESKKNPNLQKVLKK
jgi:hypothetical protein